MPSLEILLSFLAPQILLFLTFGFGALVTALVMLLHPNPVRAALFLVLNLFCVAVLYLFLNAYFLAAVQVVVYAGAIMVLFLFVIMLLNLGVADKSKDRLRAQQPLAAVAGVVLASLLAVTLVRTMRLPVLDEAGNVPVETRQPRTQTATPQGTLSNSAEPIAATGAPGAEPVKSEAAGPILTDEPVGTTTKAVPTAEQGTVAGIGLALYDPARPYLFAFEATSILLLIATIGSVVLASRRTPDEKMLATEDYD